MGLIVSGLAELHEVGLGEELISKAKELLSKILLPKTITNKVVDMYVRKALRVGVWRFLKQESKALLHLTRKKVTVVKSLTLKSILLKLFLEIELHTFKGKALFYGIILAMRKPMHKLNELLKNIPQLLTIGISYLNNPPIYRIYG